MHTSAIALDKSDAPSSNMNRT